MGKLPQKIIEMAATREWRLHHYLWHSIRQSWWKLSKEDQVKLHDLGWEPPRKAFQNDTEERNPEAGIDFFYMHMQMINIVNAELKKINDLEYQQIEGWKDIPSPDSKEYPVPPGEGDVKTNDFYKKEIEPRNKLFKDPEYLKTITINQLGAEIEFTVHGWMHMRWSVEPHKIRPRIALTKNPNIDPEWNDPSYDYLGDFYSSHVNPLFWKIHGWVNDRIEDWKKANNQKEIDWPKDWSLNEMSTHIQVAGKNNNTSFAEAKMLNTFAEQHIHSQHKAHTHSLENMMQVLAILAKSGHCNEFYEDTVFSKPVKRTEAVIDDTLSTMSPAQRKQFDKFREQTAKVNEQAEVRLSRRQQSQGNRVQSWQLTKQPNQNTGWFSWFSSIPLITQCLPGTGYGSTVQDENSHGEKSQTTLREQRQLRN